MNQDDLILAENAVKFIKQNKIALVEKFADDNSFPSYDNPVSVFMAGSPGAGKTEFSKGLLKKFNFSVVRIDPDEIRNILPGYNGKNSYIFQSAVSIGVEKLHDYVLSKRKNFILDGTFSSYETGLKNINRSLDKSGPVLIQFIYQDPYTAWDFTKKREALEGRYIPKDVFVDQFFESRKVVNEIKSIFGKKVTVDLFSKNYNTNQDDIQLNVDNLDSHIKQVYTKEDLITKLI